MHILLTRDAAKSQEWIDALQSKGHHVSCISVTKSLSLADHYRALDAALKEIHLFDAILCTSKQTVTLLAKRGVALDLPFFAAGPATAKMIQKHWDVPVHFSKEELGEEGLVTVFESRDLKGKRFLWPRSNLSGNFLLQHLRQKGVEVFCVEVYQTVEDLSQKENLQKILEEKPELVIFFSPSQVKAFRNMTIFKTHFAAIGKTTAAALKEAGEDVYDLQAISIFPAG